MGVPLTGRDHAFEAQRQIAQPLGELGFAFRGAAHRFNLGSVGAGIVPAHAACHAADGVEDRLPIDDDEIAGRAHVAVEAGQCGSSGTRAGCTNVGTRRRAL